MAKHVAILGDLTDRQLALVWKIGHDLDIFYAAEPGGSELFNHLGNEMRAFVRNND